MSLSRRIVKKVEVVENHYRMVSLDADHRSVSPRVLLEHSFVAFAEPFSFAQEEAGGLTLKFNR
ncbi:predicted protein [Arabidopsis lyrata subsp. lyrata]|uniref:Predicted protein n=1 Tax=Arabidopsis lyrata subsp. lyrata TaxID=81972 RepID=D7KVF4_ARALL|nr:predicted protein [Arabidopsis lyrata subsp. lyrata]